MAAASELPSSSPPFEHPSRTPGTRRAPGPPAACPLPSAHFAPTTPTSRSPSQAACLRTFARRFCSPRAFPPLSQDSLLSILGPWLESHLHREAFLVYNSQGRLSSWGRAVSQLVHCGCPGPTAMPRAVLRTHRAVDGGTSWPAKVPTGLTKAQSLELLSFPEPRFPHRSEEGFGKHGGGR